MTYREDLIQAAVRAFARRGPEGTTVSDIASEAGVSQPRISQIFGNKDHAWDAAYTWSRGVVLTALAEEASGTDNLDQIWASTSSRHPEAMMVLLHCMSASQQFPAMRQNMRGMLAEMADLASAHGHAPDEFICGGLSSCLQISLGVQSLTDLASVPSR